MKVGCKRQKVVCKFVGFNNFSYFCAVIPRIAGNALLALIRGLAYFLRTAFAKVFF